MTDSPDLYNPRGQAQTPPYGAAGAQNQLAINALQNIGIALGNIQQQIAAVGFYAGSYVVGTFNGSTLTMGRPGRYTFNGTTATWTFPSIAASSAVTYHIYNNGSGNLTLARSGTDEFYSGGAAVTSVTVAAGGIATVYDDNTYWQVS